MKKIVKKYPLIYSFFINIRSVLRIIYNTKARSRFLWNIRKGDTKLTMNYPLDNNSIVVDVGSYKGEFIEKLNKRHQPIIHAIEPIEEFNDYLSKKFQNYPNIIIHKFGILDKTKKVTISKLGAGSSIYDRKEGASKELISLVSMSEFMKNEKLDQIDLLYLNIEGSEYQLLNHMIENNLIENVKHLQIQFHNYLENATLERRKLRRVLKKTHVCKFNFPFIWERWDKI